MKKVIGTLCIAGSLLALAACNTTGTGSVETAAPYASERTAGSPPASSTPAQTQAQSERVFRGTQSK